MIRRRALLTGVATLGFPALGPGRAAGAARNVVLVVGAPAGSNSDQVARGFAPFLERHLPGVVIQIRNVPGEAGATAYRSIAAAPADGQVLGWVATPSLSARSVDRADGTLLERLRLLGAVQLEPVTYVFRPALPIGSTQELIQRSGTERQAMPLATPPAGSPPHLAVLQLQATAGAKLAIITFPSAAAARQAVLAGNAAAAALGLADALPGLREGRLAGLVAAPSGQIDTFPDLPLRHDPALPGASAIRRGLAGPARLPLGYVLQLDAAMRDVVADPEFAAEANSSGFLVEWLAGPAWSAIAESERTSLTGLWRSAAWLPVGAG